VRPDVLCRSVRTDRPVGPLSTLPNTDAAHTVGAMEASPDRVPVPLVAMGAPPPSAVALARQLRDASAVQIRRIRPDDRDALAAFYAGLSAESRRTRFLGPTGGIALNQSTYFCCPDHEHREGFVAVAGPVGRLDRIVGHVCVEPDGPFSAEIAVAVADDIQGRGLGRRLVDVAVAWARVDGFTTLTATMLAGNPQIQRLLSGLGLASTTTPVGAGVVEIRINLASGGNAAA
jgi:GNAT superfamily N-acetyltransferase